jgi:hypothetical protein
VLIVEGDGDVLAAPHLVGKIGARVGESIYASRPIRVGGWFNLRKAGGLEKWVRVAATRPECDRVVVLCDLDDLCPAIEKALIRDRAAALSLELGFPVEIAFCMREFESWLLHSRDVLAAAMPQYGWREADIPNPEKVRDAKGMLRTLMTEPYAESLDQEVLTKALDCRTLYVRSRSFRSFAKAVTGYSYDDLGAAF